MSKKRGAPLKFGEPDRKNRSIRLSNREVEVIKKEFKTLQLFIEWAMGKLKVKK